jgi:hypothetical protein
MSDMNPRFQQIVAGLDDCALGRGAVAPFLAEAGLPLDVARALVRARRLRVLDWLAQAGLSVVNVLPEAVDELLALADVEGLHDKYAVAGGLWRRLEAVSSRRDPSGWLAEVGRFEVLLIEARRSRGARRAPAADEPLALAPEVTVGRADPRVQEVHQRLPAFDVPRDRMDGIVTAAVAPLAGQRPEPSWLAAVPGVGDGEGAVVELTDAVADVIRATAAAPGTTLDALLGRLAQDELDTLVAMQIFIPRREAA